MKNKIVSLVVLVVAALAFNSWYTGKRPSYWLEKGDVQENFVNAHDANHEALKKAAEVVLEDDGNVNPEKTAATVDRQVDISVRLDDLEEARLAKLEHRIPSFAIPIRASQNSWRPIGYVDGPAWLRVAGKINGATPAGVPKPASYRNSKTVMEVMGDTTTPYLAPLYYSCKEGSSCNKPRPIEDKMLICPGDDLTGQGYLWFNERVEFLGTPTTEFFYNNQFSNPESFWVWLTEDGDATAACAARAGARIVAQR